MIGRDGMVKSRPRSSFTHLTLFPLHPHSALDPKFNHYDFSGPLRPWRVTPQMTVPAHVQRVSECVSRDGRGGLARGGCYRVNV